MCINGICGSAYDKICLSKQSGYRAGGTVAPTLIIQYTNDPRLTAPSASGCFDTNSGQVSSKARFV